MNPSFVERLNSASVLKLYTWNFGLSSGTGKGSAAMQPVVINRARQRRTSVIQLVGSLLAPRAEFENFIVLCGKSFCGSFKRTVVELRKANDPAVASLDINMKTPIPSPNSAAHVPIHSSVTTLLSATAWQCGQPRNLRLKHGTNSGRWLLILYMSWTPHNKTNNITLHIELRQAFTSSKKATTQKGV